MSLQTRLAALIVAIKGAVDAKAPLASPTFTGTPTAPTQPAGDNTTRIATTAFVQGEVSDVNGGTPGSIDYGLISDPVSAGVFEAVSIVEVTQAEYDALTPDANTLYVVSG